MKKILFGFAIVAGAMGLYTTASGESNDFSTGNTGVYVESLNDTIPGKKRDTTNRRPLPQDTITRDSAQVFLKAGVAQ